MKQLMALAECVIFLLGLAGCQNADRDVEVITGSRDRFPEFLVGRWDSVDTGWNIVFVADGSISAVRIPITPGRLIPNETTVVEMEDGSECTFKLGDCVADYQAQTSELTVVVDVEHFRIVSVSGSIEIEGGGIDVLAGTIYEGEQMWEAAWYGNFPKDPNGKEVSRPVVFKKVLYRPSVSPRRGVFVIE